MVFNNLTILVNTSLDRNNMKEKTLYLFKGDNDSVLSAWLEKGEIKLRKVEDKRG
jgi:hypothetical protein